MATEYATSTNGATLPREDNTMTLRMSWKQFNSFLHEMHGNPKNEDWKVPSIELPDCQFDRSKYSQIEIFADTLVGPIVAQHLSKADAVQVTVNRPKDAIWRTAQDLIAEVRSGVAA